MVSGIRRLRHVLTPPSAHRAPWRVSTESLSSAAAVVGALVFLLGYFEPALLFSESTPTGGDSLSHFATASFFHEHLAPQGRISGWSMGNYAGYPLLLFYFPLGFVLISWLAHLLPLAVAFKLVIAAAVFAMPPAAWGLLRALRFAYPTPLIGLLFALLFLFQEGNSMWGGNISSTLAGEFSYGLSLVFTMVYLASLAHGASTPRSTALRGALLLLIGLSHGYTLIFAGLASVAVLFRSRRWTAELGLLAAGNLLGVLLLGFWLLPLLANLPYCTVFNITWIFSSYREILPVTLWPLVPLTVLVWFEARRSGPAMRWSYFFLAWSCWVAVALYAVAVPLGLSDVRFVPFAQLAWILLVAAGVGSFLRRRRLRALLVLGLAAVSLAWVDTGRPAVRDWIRWNFSGIEAKPLGSPVREICRRLSGGPDEPRVAYEHSVRHEATGTVLTFESLPFLSGRSTLEGLYLQSSLTAPFVFYIQAEMSRTPANPLPDFIFPDYDPARGAEHLALFNVSKFIAVSPELKQDLNGLPQFRPAFDVPPYSVYHVAGSSRDYVVPLPFQPVLYRGADWKEVAYRWFRDATEDSVFVVLPPGLKPGTSHPFPVVDSSTVADPPAIPLEGNVRVRSTVADDRISIRTDAPGHPLLIKVSFHPGWRARGADRIYAATPNFMIVVPTEHEVELTFGAPPMYRFGLLSSAVGLLCLAALLVASRWPPGFRWLAPQGSASSPSSNRSGVVALALVVALTATLFAVRPRAPVVDLHRALGHYEQERWSSAERVLEQLIERPTPSGVTPRARLMYGLCALRDERIDEALQRFEEVVARHPETAEAAQALYHVALCQQRLGREDSAVRTYRLVASRYPYSVYAPHARQRLEEFSRP